MELMQFTAVIVLTLLALKLLLLPRKVALNAVVGKARWLMVVGIGLLDVQFLLQYIFGLRAMGVTQAVMVNLLLFIPVSWSVSLALIILQRQGHTSRTDRWVGAVVWMVVVALLGVTAATDGLPLMSSSPQLFNAEVAASVLYLTMQGHYSYIHLRNLIQLQRALQNYYDRDTDGLLRWMKLSILVLMVLSLMVPLLIFVQSMLLAIFAILFFVGIFFLVDSFCGYAVSSAPKKVSDAEENKAQEDEELANNSSAELVPDVMLHVEEAVDRWIARGGYRESGINLPAAAEAIGVPRYLLSAWLKTDEQRTYSSWMTALRIEEAQRVIKAHPDWNNETIAAHCGFADRSYFQRKFKELTGITPAQYTQQV